MNAPESVELTPTHLRLRWANGRADLPAPTLRAACRCAQCRAMAPAVSTTVRLVGLEPVGHYGVQLAFSDSHARGIYPWDYLHSVAQSL